MASLETRPLSRTTGQRGQVGGPESLARVHLPVYARKTRFAGHLWGRSDSCPACCCSPFAASGKPSGYHVVARRCSSSRADTVLLPTRASRLRDSLCRATLLTSRLPGWLTILHPMSRHSVVQSAPIRIPCSRMHFLLQSLSSSKTLALARSTQRSAIHIWLSSSCVGGNGSKFTWHLSVFWCGGDHHCEQLHCVILNDISDKNNLSTAYSLNNQHSLPSAGADNHKS